LKINYTFDKSFVERAIDVHFLPNTNAHIAPFFSRISFQDDVLILNLMFKMEYRLSESANKSFQFMGMYILAITDEKQSLQDDLKSDESNEILADILKIKSDDFHYKMKGKYYSQFNKHLIGVSPYTLDECKEIIPRMIDLYEVYKKNDPNNNPNSDSA
jgi:hypothetical protein